MTRSEFKRQVRLVRAEVATWSKSKQRQARIDARAIKRRVPR